MPQQSQSPSSRPRHCLSQRRSRRKRRRRIPACRRSSCPVRRPIVRPQPRHRKAWRASRHRRRFKFALSNQEIPGQGHPAAYGRPPLSLDLHYLFTAFGAGENDPDADLEAQQILGDAMSTLNEFAVVNESLTITRPEIGTVGDPLLDPSLLREFERIKITLQPVQLEDMSSLWAALPDANFRRSVAYQLSVVQIVSRRTRRYPPLVGEPPAGGPALLVVPMKRPCIEELRFRGPGDHPNTQRRFVYGRVGDTLIILGTALRDQHSRVLLGNVDATASITHNEPDRVELTIPNNPGLQPGAAPVKVIHEVMIGDPPSPRPAFQSNAAVFMLVPL